MSNSNKFFLNFPQTYQIGKIVKETNLITTFFFTIEKIAKEAKPGQFVMVWVPNVNEKPMSLSYIRDDKIGITFKKVGETTKELSEKKVGSYIGIRGPYGRGFAFAEVSKALILGGGVGIAPLALLAEKISQKGKEKGKGQGHVTAVIGAKTASEIIFLDRLEKACENVIVTTEDGSLGVKGLLTDILPEILKKEKFEKAFMCGPEAMLVKGVKILENFKIDGELSLERWMKCGIGICGQCVVDPLGLRVCKEGPVFDLKTITKIEELGKYKRLSSGVKIKIE